jgi:purine-binding chemotaxis protein CheW
MQNAKFIQGLSHRDGKLLSLVDLEQLLLDDEWEALKSF